MNGAIIGLGYISSKGHLPSYSRMKDVSIVAVADVSEERLNWARIVIPGIRTYSTYQDLLAAEHELDFIDIATPPVFHGEIALAAAAKGIHVLCEKPITTSVDEARSLILAAASKRVVIFPCHNYKHAPVVKKVKELIDTGAIGEVTSATLSTFRPTHAKGVKEWFSDWRRVKQYSGGGIAMDHGSHSFYLMFLFMGAYPTSVSAKAHTLEKKWDTEDNVSATFTFPKGFCNVFLTWTAGARKVIYTIQGTKGSITINDDEVEISTATGIEKHLVLSAFNDASHTTWFTSMFEAFKSAVKSKDFVSRELEEAYMCVNVIDRIYESVASQCCEVPVSARLDGRVTKTSSKKIDTLV